MRLHQLEISGFLAYGGTETVDFDHLSEAGFFLIHGQTGAGKTSLLDAVAFAIYGALPGARKNVKSLRSDHATDATETYVVLDATVGSRRLRIRRRPKYEVAKGEGKAKKVDALLTVEQMVDGTWVALDVTKQGAGTEISRWIGFDADQFFRMALIPQGAFADFLHATSKEREAVLKDLFEVDQMVFQRIEEYFDAKLRSATKAVDDADSTLGKERARVAEVLTASGVAADDVVDSAWIDARAIAEQAALDAANAVRDTGKWTLDDALAAENAAEAFIKASVKYQAAAAELEGAKRRLADERSALADLLDGVDATDAEAALEAAQQSAAIALEELRQRNARLQELDVARQARADAVAAVESNEQALAEVVRSIDDAAPELAELAAAAAAGLAAADDLAKATTAHQAAEATAKAVAARDTATAAIAALERTLADADAAFSEADAALDDAEALQRSQFAVALAAVLEADAPCPVCGSLEHPAPAQPDAEWHAAADAVEAARERREALSQARGRAESALHVGLERVADRCAVLGQQAALTIEEAERFHSVTASALGAVKSLIASAQQAQKEHQALAEVQRQRELTRGALLAAGPGLAAAATSAQSALGALETAIGIEAGASAEPMDDGDAAARVQRISSGRTALRGAINAEAAAVAALAALDTGGDGTLPELEALRQARVEAEAAFSASVKEVARLEGVVTALHARRAAFDRALTLHGTAKESHDAVAALARPINGSGRSRTKLTQYYLSARLRQVLDSANSRLQRMTDGRFLFVFDDGATGRGYKSLEIAVHDSWNGAQREVSSLSGGETFTASLALALGLADIVQAEAGGTALDSLFIDEGFGTLSPDFLGRVVEDLDRLRAGGRLVGIISHVEDLKQRIPVQLEVRKTNSGSTLRMVGDPGE